VKNNIDLIDGLDILKYEEDMLCATFNELKCLHPLNASKVIGSSGITVEYPHPHLIISKYIHDAILESFLIHVRIFIEFLYGKRKPKYPNDILAEDYFDPPAKWHKIIRDEPCEFKNTKENLDKYLAHISMMRKRSELDKQWDCSKLYEWITTELKLFHENIEV
jgi:hypothetical protein